MREARPFLEREGAMPVQPRVNKGDESTYGHFNTGSSTTQRVCCPMVAQSY